jgi:hypothetical protein
MPLTRNQTFGAIAIVAGATFAIMAILGAPAPAFAVTAVVVGALNAILAIFWKEPPSNPS